MTIKAKNTTYDERFRSFLSDITAVSLMEPRAKYLYKIMDGVPFKDLETAILMANIDYDATINGNKRK